MYPDLSYILHAIFGTDPDNVFAIVKTFGLFLGFAFMASGYAFYLELKRKHENGLIPASTELRDEWPVIRWQDVILQSCPFWISRIEAPLYYKEFRCI